MYRRDAIKGICSVTFSIVTIGCLGIGNIQDISVYNNSESKIEFSIIVTNDESGETTLDESSEIRPGEDTKFANPLTTEETYEITVETNQPLQESITWTEPSESVGLVIRIRDDEITFEKIQS